ncbi:Abi family protein [Candidatus Omnitrophus magneticus]|uniref:Abi family protein n=1 Tax=Candidatus Omnitrophus magneticus TaxID=1609969 RepID=A0A0F0CJV9_9BACT|nr:Abi family protein [Candidatus Omnitrophus magneticus]
MLNSGGFFFFMVCFMIYDKPHLSFHEQADQLIQRGLIAHRDSLIESLKHINYYSFTGYLYPFRKKDDNFIEGTTFEKILFHYKFDSQLRVLIMEAIDRIEISIRTKLIYILADNFGAFGYTSHNVLLKLSFNRKTAFGHRYRMLRCLR